MPPPPPAPTLPPLPPAPLPPASARQPASIKRGVHVVARRCNGGLEAVARRQPRSHRACKCAAGAVRVGRGQARTDDAYRVVAVEQHVRDSVAGAAAAGVAAVV
eukprot:353616-Chlamydomonas_euryale.AAC.1